MVQRHAGGTVAVGHVARWVNTLDDLSGRHIHGTDQRIGGADGGDGVIASVYHHESAAVYLSEAVFQGACVVEFVER